MQRVPGAIRGKTPEPGSTYNTVAAVGDRLKECSCGQRKLGWQEAEFIAQDGGSVVTGGFEHFTLQGELCAESVG